MSKLLRRGARWLLPLFAVIAIPFVVLAAYDVTGVSDAEPFTVGSAPAHTPTSTASAEATYTVTPVSTATFTSTPSATATPRACASVADASLEFRPDEVKETGTGPFDVTLTLRNTGRQGYAVDVALALSTVKGATYLDSVDLPGGATWSIDGAPGSTTYPVGDIAPRGEIGVPLRVYMRPNWSSARDARAAIRVTVASAGCARHPSRARATITLESRTGDHDGSATQEARFSAGTPRGEERASTGTPTPAATETAAWEPTATSTPDATATDTPTAFATPEPSLAE